MNRTHFLFHRFLILIIHLLGLFMVEKGVLKICNAVINLLIKDNETLISGDL